MAHRRSLAHYWAVKQGEKGGACQLNKGGVAQLESGISSREDGAKKVGWELFQNLLSITGSLNGKHACTHTGFKFHRSGLRRGRSRMASGFCPPSERLFVLVTLNNRI